MRQRLPAYGRYCSKSRKSNEAINLAKGDFQTSVPLRCPAVRRAAARAERSDFAITLRHDFDHHAGAAEVFPQEITRALLNLISNGFYAATRRKIESGNESFEPVLSASTRNLGTSVEIRIRDNGTGIPPEVKEKISFPFHYEADRGGNGIRPFDNSRHHCQTTWRPDRGRDQSRRIYRVHHYPAERRGQRRWLEASMIASDRKVGARSGRRGVRIFSVFGTSRT